MREHRICWAALLVGLLFLGCLFGCGGSADNPVQNGTESDQSGSVPLASVTITEGPSIYMGSVALGSTVTTTYNLANSGGTEATNIAASFSVPEFYFAGGAYPGTGGTCGVILAAGTYCLVAVSFTPAAIPMVTTPLEIDYFNGTADVSNTSVIFSGQSFAH